MFQVSLLPCLSRTSSSTLTKEVEYNNNSESTPFAHLFINDDSPNIFVSCLVNISASLLILYVAIPAPLISLKLNIMHILVLVLSLSLLILCPPTYSWPMMGSRKDVKYNRRTPNSSKRQLEETVPNG